MSRIGPEVLLLELGDEVGLEHEEIDQEAEQVVAHLGVVDEHLAAEGGGGDQRDR